MTDRDLLTTLYKFLTTKRYVTMEEESLHDMVIRYKTPPLTALNRVAMQMTAKDFNGLNDLMKQIDEHLNPKEETVAEPDPESV